MLLREYKHLVGKQEAYDKCKAERQYDLRILSLYTFNVPPYRIVIDQKQQSRQTAKQDHYALLIEEPSMLKLDPLVWIQTVDVLEIPVMQDYQNIIDDEASAIRDITAVRDCRKCRGKQRPHHR